MLRARAAARLPTQPDKVSQQLAQRRAVHHAWQDVPHTRDAKVELDAPADVPPAGIIARRVLTLPLHTVRQQLQMDAPLERALQQLVPGGWQRISTPALGRLHIAAHALAAVDGTPHVFQELVIAMHHEIVKLANRVVLSHIALARARPVLRMQVDARGGARTRVACGAAVFGGLAARAAHLKLLTGDLERAHATELGEARRSRSRNLLQRLPF
jgi:hypothetical protein